MKVFQTTDTHGDHTKSKFCFFATALKKEKLPTLNFLSRFLSHAFSTFASREFLFVEKITNKKLTPFGKLAKELKPSRQTKTLSKKFFLPTPSWQVLCFTTVLYSIDSVAQFGGLAGMRQEEQQRIQQQNRQLMQQFGGTPPPTQQEINAATQNRINGKPPALTVEEKRRQYTTDLLNEVHSREPQAAEYWKAPDFASKEKPYLDAFNKLKDQLTGKRPLSVADAYYQIEQAEGNPMLTKDEFKAEIKRAATFIKRWMMENGYDSRNNLSLHLAIQQFLSQKLTVGKQVKDIPNVNPEMHAPIYYDYDDYKAQKDNRSYHVSKAFATGNGQCHILPLMYACIAEELGAKYYLSYAPFHSFIKFPDNKGTIHDYEVTTNWEITDQWYKDNLGVSGIAERNKIYLHPMDNKQIVAAAVIDLAYSYKKKNGIADGKFINECVDFAMNYFPDKQANIDAWLMRNELNAVELDRLLMKKGVKAISDAEQIPETKPYFEKMHQINKKIESLGYTEDDVKVYEQMIEESKARHPEAQGKNNLQKRNLYLPLK